MTPVEHPYWVWILFFAIVLTALFVDIGIVNRHSHVPTRRETFGWATVWVSLAIGFNIFLYWQVGNHYQDWDLAAAQAKLFLTGYLIELSLSVDNLFVFLLIFGYFKVPKEFQHRVLFWGIMGALIMRMIMIFAGAELVERFHWIIYVFGAFLLYTGLKMFKDTDDDFDPTESGIVKLTTRYIRISKEYDGDKFFVVKDGVRTGTLLFLVLIVVEFTDLIFAVDSIPAIFGITTDRFIIYTSNIFAILGLRTFFFLLADIADRFHYLKIGLAFILTFIGVKMLLPLIAEGLIMITGAGSGNIVAGFAERLLRNEFKQEIINISLGVVVAAITLSIILSLIFPTKPSDAETASAAQPED
ncbi:MAG: TerC family protein [Blastocatellia bacterium]|nr:TerC family protein [Chloracidobacterium sp.]MBL8186039.1 TerC family protein [Blastocatellia bacterium]HRJ87987.1 TerC family protein [Pyrinomonadaceae bacterium]HRK49732.1 TerC family protein [Pyrinomonadaceae bacterium]